MNKLVAILLFSLMVLLPSGFFDVNRFISAEIQHNRISSQLQHYALSKGLASALYYQRSQYPQGSELWLSYSQRLATQDDKVAYELGCHYVSVKAMAKALQWLKVAINLGNQQASIKLAKLLFAQGQYAQVKKLLAKGGNDGSHDDIGVGILALLLQIALIEGDGQDYANYASQLSKAANSVNKLSNTAIEQAKVLLAQLKRFRVNEFFAGQPSVTLASQKLITGDKAHQCLRTLQFVASNLTDLQRAEQLITEIEQSELGAFFCFSPPKYVSTQALACDSDSASKTIACNVAAWDRFARNIDSDHLAVLVAQGKANVQGGILYLDRQDEVAVVKHELTHLLGFVDEYPLPVKHFACQQEHQEQQLGIAHNLALIPNSLQQFVDNLAKTIEPQSKAELRQKLLSHIPWAKQIKASTPLLTWQGGLWQLGTPAAFANEIGLFASNTCQKNNSQSFKPWHNITTLEYFDSHFPLAYRQLLLAKPSAYLMPSFHYYLSYQLEQQGKMSASRWWLSAARARANRAR